MLNIVIVVVLLFLLLVFLFIIVSISTGTGFFFFFFFLLLTAIFLFVVYGTRAFGRALGGALILVFIVFVIVRSGTAGAAVGN